VCVCVCVCVCIYIYIYRAISVEVLHLNPNCSFTNIYFTNITSSMTAVAASDFTFVSW